MAKVENGLIDQIWDPACRIKDDDLWAFNMKVDGVIYGRCLDTKETTYEMHDSLKAGDRVSFDYEEKGKYKNFKEVDVVGSVAQDMTLKRALDPEDTMTDEEYLQKNWDTAYRIARNAIQSIEPELVKLCKEFNPGAYMEALEKTAVSVSIDMKQRGL